MHTFSLKITDSTKPIHLNYFFHERVEPEGKGNDGV